jgi:tetratricopeptide (TPR) repeat protein
MGERLGASLREFGTVQGKFEELGRFLFDREGFQTPERDDASAFLLPEVLRAKRGNCLGLSVLCLILAEEAGWRLHLVPVPNRLTGPGHVFVRYDDGKNRRNFDPAQRGASKDDSRYKNEFKLREEHLRSGYILGNASKRDVCHLLLVNLAAWRIGEGRGAQALGLLRAAMALRPDHAWTHMNQGAACLALGRLGPARQSYAKALELEPGLVGAKLGMAELGLREGRSEEAEVAVMEVLAEEPENGEAKSIQANLYLIQGQHRLAAQALKEVAVARPKDVRARCNLGTALLKSGDFETAHRAFEEAIKLDPRWPDAHFGLGEYFRAVGRGEEAQKAFGEALRLDPGHLLTRMAQGQAALGAGKLDLAEKAFMAVLKTRPGHLDASLALVQLFLQRQRVAEAEKIVKEAQANFPGQPALALMQSILKMGQGQFGEALRTAQTALPTLPAGHPVRNPLIQNIALCLGKLGNHGKALETARQLLETDPKDLATLQIAAAACQALGDKRLARDYWRKVLDLDPTNPNARRALGQP